MSVLVCLLLLQTMVSYNLLLSCSQHNTELAVSLYSRPTHCKQREVVSSRLQWVDLTLRLGSPPFLHAGSGTGQLGLWSTAGAVLQYWGQSNWQWARRMLWHTTALQYWPVWYTFRVHLAASRLQFHWMHVWKIHYWCRGGKQLPIPTYPPSWHFKSTDFQRSRLAKKCRLQ